LIKLNRTSKPDKLTDQLEAQLVAQFKADGSNVWNKDFIKDALLNLSNEKCCYCECNIKEESKYMEVEHFYPKNIYPDLVTNWDNLLPSCKRCNTNKGEHDPNIEYIINPCKDDPKIHIGLKHYRFKGKDQVGKQTLDVLYLNDTDRLVKPRFLIGNQVQVSLEEITDKLKDYYSGISTSTRRKNIIVNGIKSLLKLGEPSKDFSATIATIILNDDNYTYCKDILKELNLWDKELNEQETILSQNCLDLF
jgi:uncharacterized protein (TIGR02646 family)